MASVPDKWREWPEYFLANSIDELSAGIFKWRTLKNLRCKSKIPAGCFIKVSERKILIARDEFLAWVEGHSKAA